MRPTRYRVDRSTSDHALRAVVLIAESDTLFGLAPREVYRDPADRSAGGGLLHRRFTLTLSRMIERFVFCDTSLSAVFSLASYSWLPLLEHVLATPSRKARCPLEFGLSSFDQSKPIESDCPMTWIRIVEGETSSRDS